ncbi:MAG: hypothetical protein WAM44_04225, partial [Chthoniobacterales bacterium]
IQLSAFKTCTAGRLSRSSGASPYQVQNEYEEQWSSHLVESGADFSPTRKKEKAGSIRGGTVLGANRASNETL